MTPTPFWITVPYGRSLGVDAKDVTYNFDLWWAYTSFCRKLAQEAGVSMRELDRALWQYSKVKQNTG